jgi:hypothetical protein
MERREVMGSMSTKPPPYPFDYKRYNMVDPYKPLPWYVRHPHLATLIVAIMTGAALWMLAYVSQLKRTTM